MCDLELPAARRIGKLASFARQGLRPDLVKERLPFDSCFS